MNYELSPIGVTPQEIVDQRAEGWPDFHPERYCHKCGHLNVWAWSVDSALWNDVAEPHDIWCPQCFTAAYAAKHGPHTAWRLMLADEVERNRVEIAGRKGERVDLIAIIEQQTEELERIRERVAMFETEYGVALHEPEDA